MQKRGAAIQRIWGLLAVIGFCGTALAQTVDQSSQLSPVPGTGVLIYLPRKCGQRWSFRRTPIIKTAKTLFSF